MQNQNVSSWSWNQNSAYPPVAGPFPSFPGGNNVNQNSLLTQYQPVYGAPPPSTTQAATNFDSTQSQWTAAQLQHWQQWQQWQEKYQEWQAQYGKKYAETMVALGQNPGAVIPTIPPMLGGVTKESEIVMGQGFSSPNPPLPSHSQQPVPPPPPDDEQRPPLPSSPGLKEVQKKDKSTKEVPKDNPEELSEAEKTFDIQFKQWEGQFTEWKKQNEDHPDKAQYREYEKKWESWREQLLQRREQMRRKRLSKISETAVDNTRKVEEVKSKPKPPPVNNETKDKQIADPVAKNQPIQSPMFNNEPLKFDKKPSPYSNQPNVFNNTENQIQQLPTDVSDSPGVPLNQPANVVEQETSQQPLSQHGNFSNIPGNSDQNRNPNIPSLMDNQNFNRNTNIPSLIDNQNFNRNPGFFGNQNFKAEQFDQFGNNQRINKPGFESENERDFGGNQRFPNFENRDRDFGGQGPPRFAPGNFESNRGNNQNRGRFGNDSVEKEGNDSNVEPGQRFGIENFENSRMDRDFGQGRFPDQNRDDGGPSNFDSFDKSGRGNFGPSQRFNEGNFNPGQRNFPDRSYGSEIKAFLGEPSGSATSFNNPPPKPKVPSLFDITVEKPPGLMSPKNDRKSKIWEKFQNDDYYEDPFDNQNEEKEQKADSDWQGNNAWAKGNTPWQKSREVERGNFERLGGGRGKWDRDSGRGPAPGSGNRPPLLDDKPWARDNVNKDAKSDAEKAQLSGYVGNLLAKLGNFNTMPPDGPRGGSEPSEDPSSFARNNENEGNLPNERRPEDIRASSASNNSWGPGRGRESVGSGDGTSRQSGNFGWSGSKPNNFTSNQERFDRPQNFGLADRNNDLNEKESPNFGNFDRPPLRDESGPFGRSSSNDRNRFEREKGLIERDESIPFGRDERGNFERDQRSPSMRDDRNSRRIGFGGPEGPDGRDFSRFERDQLLDREEGNSIPFCDNSDEGRKDNNNFGRVGPGNFGREGLGNFGRDVLGNFGRDGPGNFGRDGPGNFGRDGPGNFGRDGPGNFGRDGPGNFGRDGPGNFGRDGPGNFGRDGPGNFGRDGPGNFGRDGPGNFGRDGPGNFGRDGPGNFGRDGPGNFGRDGPGNFGRDSPGNFGRDNRGNFGREGSGNFGRDGPGNFGRDGPNNFGRNDQDSFGRDDRRVGREEERPFNWDDRNERNSFGRDDRNPNFRGDRNSVNRDDRDMIRDDRDMLRNERDRFFGDDRGGRNDRLQFEREFRGERGPFGRDDFRMRDWNNKRGFERDELLDLERGHRGPFDRFDRDGRRGGSFGRDSPYDHFGRSRDIPFKELEWNPQVFDYSQGRPQNLPEGDEGFQIPTVVDYSHGEVKQTFDYGHGGKKADSQEKKLVEFGQGEDVPAVIDYGHGGDRENIGVPDWKKEKEKMVEEEAAAAAAATATANKTVSRSRSKSKSPVNRFGVSKRTRSRSPPRYRRDSDSPPFRGRKSKSRDFGRNSSKRSRGEENIDKTQPTQTSENEASKGSFDVTTVLVEDLICSPGRETRPNKLVFIMRGLPGSGKTYVTKLIKDKEVEVGGSARILSLDDYFTTENEKEETDPDTGRKVIKKVTEYEYEEAMEPHYRGSLLKAFKKTISDGFFSFIIVDSINERTKDYEEMWSFAKQKGFQVYIAEMDNDVTNCTKRNIHKRTESEISGIAKVWEDTPHHYLRLDVRSLLQSDAIDEVEMEEVTEETEAGKKDEEKDKDKDKEQGPENGGSKEDEEDDPGVSAFVKSRWDHIENSEQKLDRLDGLKRRREGFHTTMEDYLQLPDEFESSFTESRPGKKRVRWADLEERRQQEKMRAIGFVVGRTDWSRMTDPTFGESALTRTKYI